MSKLIGNISEGLGNLKRKFENNTYVTGTKNFLNSNSIFAKFAFLILMLFLFVFVLRLGTSILTWIFSPSPNPVLYNGMFDATQLQVIRQDPSVKGAIPVIRSNNDYQGLDFTYSVWIYVKDIVYKEKDYKHIFHKGNDNINITDPPYGLNRPNNAPGLYIAPETNELVVMMNTFDSIDEEITVPDLPLNKWVNVIIRVSKQRQLDVYINGTLSKRKILASIVKQNYGDVYLSMNGGFSGYTSQLQYFNSALGTNAIQGIVDKGPNLKMNDKDMHAVPYYLSSRWYFANSLDAYNP